MSTEAVTQTVAPGTPGSEATPLQTSAKSMISDAFKTSPAEPAKAAPVAPAAPAPAEKAQPPAKPVAPKDQPLIKPKEEATPKAEAATVELPEDKIAIPTNASPEAVKNFAAYKESMKAILTAERKRAADAEARANVHQAASPADAQAAAEREARLKAAEDRLLVLDVQSHPDFHRQYIEPRDKALTTVKEVLAYNEKPATELTPILSKPLKDFNAEVSKLTEGMNAADSSTVMQSLRAAREAHNSSQAAIAKAGDVHKQLSAQSAQRQKQAFESVVNEVIPNFTKLEAEEGMSPEQRQSVEEYNRSVDGLRTNAEALAFGKTDERSVAQMALKSSVMDHMIKYALPQLESRYNAARSTIADLTAQLEALKGARSTGALSGDTRTNGGQPPSTKQLIGEAFKR